MDAGRLEVAYMKPAPIPVWGLWMMLAASVTGAILIARQLLSGG